MAEIDGLDELLGNADMSSFRKMMDKAAQVVPSTTTTDPHIYAECFNSPAGDLVLRDMYKSYVNVSRAIPGEGSDAAFYREGMAQVVFDIALQISKAEGT